MSSTTIIGCPSCARQLRMPANRTILATCPHCARKFYVDNGRLDTIRNRMMDLEDTGAGQSSTQPKQPRRKNRPWWKHPVAYVALAMIFFVGAIAFKVNILDEWNAFNAYEANPSVETADIYLKNFRDRSRAAFVANGRDSIEVAEARATMERSCERGSCDCTPLRQLTPSNNNYASSRVPMLPVWLEAAEAGYEECMFRQTATEPSINAVNFFNDNFPESIYSDSVRAIAGGLWAGVIKDFETSRDGKRVTAQQKFFRSVLDYVAGSGKNNIYVSFKQEKELKDWKAYDQEARGMADQITVINNLTSGTTYPTPSDSPPSSISSFYRANTSTLEGQLIATVQKKMDDLFGQGMIRVQETARNKQVTGLTMKVDYLVRTLEEEDVSGLVFPSLYIWTSARKNEFGLPTQLTPEQLKLLRESLIDADPGLRKRILAQYEGKSESEDLSHMEFKGYLLASSIDWDLTMTYPDNPRPYYYESFSQPVARIDDVKTQTEAYRKMMSTAFDNFSLAFLREFGLE